jgi:hypothetical protein
MPAVNPSKIPISICIFDDAGQIMYRAYSPLEFDCPNNNSEEYDALYDDFIHRLYSHIEYDNNNPFSNNTRFGKLLETHTRHIDLPLAERQGQLYFSTFDSANCNYKPIHKESPIHFNPEWATTYANMQNQLGHRAAAHLFI